MRSSTNRASRSIVTRFVTPWMVRSPVAGMVNAVPESAPTGRVIASESTNVAVGKSRVSRAWVSMARSRRSESLARAVMSTDTSTTVTVSTPGAASARRRGEADIGQLLLDPVTGEGTGIDHPGSAEVIAWDRRGRGVVGRTGGGRAEGLDGVVGAHRSGGVGAQTR